jgi:hypothetical protein
MKWERIDFRAAAAATAVIFLFHRIDSTSSTKLLINYRDRSSGTVPIAGAVTDV